MRDLAALLHCRLDLRERGANRDGSAGPTRAHINACPIAVFFMVAP